MTNIQQREELHRTIWNIADELRGAVGGWEFKAYVLGTLFYRFISENLTDYINRLQHEAGDEGFDYADMDDEEAEGAREQMVQEKGFFILPSQLFVNVCKRCEQDENLNMTLANTFRAIEGSAIGTPSEDDMKGLFSDFNVDSTQLGGDVKTRNKLISKVLLKVRDMDLGTDFQTNKIDAFGDAYEFLMTMYASSAGKSGGEFFTPQEVSELLARLVAADGHEIRSVYDIKTPTLIQFNYSTAAYLQGKLHRQQGKLGKRGGKFSYFPFAVVELDTFGLYNVKRKSGFVRRK